MLATGAARMEEDKRGERAYHYFNSIEVLDRSGLLVRALRQAPSRAVRRIHAVSSPGCERLGVTQFVQFPGGFDAGVGSDILDIPGLPDAMAMVCYEAIFPNEWGGVRGGDAQAARLDAQRHRRRVVRPDGRPLPAFRAGAAARDRTGACRWCASPIPAISAIVDARGRIVDFAPLGQRNGARRPACPALCPPTWQSRWGSASFRRRVSVWPCS